MALNGSSMIQGHTPGCIRTVVQLVWTSGSHQWHQKVRGAKHEMQRAAGLGQRCLHAATCWMTPEEVAGTRGHRDGAWSDAPF